MRLICGILRLDTTRATVGTLDRMARAMTAPGLAPAIAHHLDGAFGAAVLDFSGTGPAPGETADWTVVADARLDRGDVDPAAALIDAIGRHGPDFPDHVHGDFAVALWRRDAGRLWLGRDFIGARPLAWTWQPGRYLAFASLPKGLHGAGLAPATRDPVAVAARVYQSYFAGADSGFTQISCLQAGHSLCIDAAGTAPPRLHRAYRPDPARVGTWRGSPEEAATTLRQLVGDAVAARLPAAGNVACHLSGGLDSSAITVLAARAMQRHAGRVIALSKVPTRRAGADEQDERPLIAAVLAQEPSLVQLTVDNVLPLPGREEDPDWPCSILGGSDDLMMAGAADFGADRILVGVGGDEGASYNGANPYAALLRQGYLSTLMRELPARARSDGAALSRTILNRLILPLLPRWLRALRRRGPRLLDPEAGAVRFLAPAIVEQVLQRRMIPILQTNSPAERATAFADHHIPSRCTYYAILAARHGLAASFPLLDRRVVDFALSLPLHMILADGQSRQPFRRAMQGILPDPVRLARRKVGPGDHLFAQYAAHKGELLASLSALRSTHGTAAAGMFDLDEIGAGLRMLPGPDDVPSLMETGRERFMAGNAPWMPIIALQCLIAAWTVASGDPAGQSGPDRG